MQFRGNARFIALISFKIGTFGRLDLKSRSMLTNGIFDWGRMMSEAMAEVPQSIQFSRKPESAFSRRARVLRKASWAISGVRFASFFPVISQDFLWAFPAFTLVGAGVDVGLGVACGGAFTPEAAFVEMIWFVEFGPLPGAVV